MIKLQNVTDIAIENGGKYLRGRNNTIMKQVTNGSDFSKFHDHMSESCFGLLFVKS